MSAPPWPIIELVEALAVNGTMTRDQLIRDFGYQSQRRSFGAAIRKHAKKGYSTGGRSNGQHQLRVDLQTLERVGLAHRDGLSVVPDRSSAELLTLVERWKTRRSRETLSSVYIDEARP